MSGRSDRDSCKEGFREKLNGKTQFLYFGRVVLKVVSVRKMVADDISRVREVMCSCYQWLGEVEGWTKEQVEFLLTERGDVETILAESKEQIYLVACVCDKIVGMAAVNGNEIAKLFVDPAYHGQRIGSSLFETAKREVIKGSFEEMIVGVMARCAIGFYEKIGMKIYCYKDIDRGAFAGSKTPLMKIKLQ